jgi:hypothetical protein
MGKFRRLGRGTPNCEQSEIFAGLGLQPPPGYSKNFTVGLTIVIAVLGICLAAYLFET